MQVRQALETDLDPVARVQARTMVASDYYEASVDFESEHQRLRPLVVGYFRGTYHPACSLPARSVIVAEHLDRIIGFVAGHVSTRMGCEAELQWMFVLPRWQRQGVGAQLLRLMAAWFTKQESTHVIVDAPPANPYRAFYLKHGASPLDEYWLHWQDIESELV